MSDWKQPRVEPGQCVIVYDGYDAPGFPMFVCEVHERFISGVRYSNGGSRFYQQCYHRTSPDMKPVQFQNGHLMWEHSKWTRRMEQIEDRLVKIDKMLEAFVGAPAGHTPPAPVSDLRPERPAEPRDKPLGYGALPSLTVDSYGQDAPSEMDVEDSLDTQEAAARKMIADFIEAHGAEGDLVREKNTIARATGLHHLKVFKLIREAQSPLLG